MYQKELVYIPNAGKGKIAKRTMKNYIQIMYVIDGGYNPITKKCSPTRTIIGKAESLNSNKMFPNDNYYKIFGSTLKIATPSTFTNRSGALKIGTYCVIEKIITEFNLQNILSNLIIDKYNFDLSGLFKDLMSNYIINEKNLDILYCDYAFNHPLFSKNMRIYSEYTIKRFFTLLSTDMFLNFINRCKNDKNIIKNLFNHDYIDFESNIKNIFGTEKIQGESSVKFLALLIRKRMEYLIHIHSRKAGSNYINVHRVISELEKIELVRQADGIYVFGNPLTQQQRLILTYFGIDDSCIISCGNAISRKLRSLNSY